MQNSLKIIGGVIAGVAVGAIVGLLSAPDSGEKTRKKIDKEASKFKDNLGKALSDTIDTLKTSYNSAVSEIAANVNEKAAKGAKMIKDINPVNSEA